jgi:WD40 repeat protein
MVADDDGGGIDNVRDRLVRKIRKKLRQIENLDCLDRELNEEEEDKVTKRDDLRKELAKILGEMKRRSKEEAEVAPVFANVSENATDAKRKKKEPTVEEARVPSNSNNLNQEEQLEISLPTPRAATPTATALIQDTEPSSSTQEYVQVRVSTPAKKGRAAGAGIGKRREEELTKREVIVHELGGHEDLAVAAAVDADRDIAVTAGRDTRVLVWKASTREEIHSLRGHTGSVTCLVILPSSANAALGCPPDDVLGLSGSVDCSLKVWNLSGGSLLRSIYTYNGIKCLVYSSQMDLAVTGTDGGKIELFDVRAGVSVHSIKEAHADIVTAIDAAGAMICSGSRDGIIKVWNCDDVKSVRCLYVSEDVNAADGEQSAHLRCIAAIRLLPSYMIAYGDSGCNVKVLDWKCGLLHKLPNHLGEHGFTDCLVVPGSSDTGQLLLASSYNLDTGLGHVNVFCVVPGQTVPNYLCSWMDDETGRIFGLGASYAGDALTFLTCGKEVKLWKTIRRKKDLPKGEDAVLVRPSLLPLYSDEAVDSGSSDDSDVTDSEETESDARRRLRNGNSEANEDKKEGSSSSGWWCNVM